MFKKTIVLLFISHSILSFSQEEKVIIIDRGVTRREKSRNPDKLVSNEYVMKFSPLQMIVGEINLGFEKRVDEMSSLEFELGPTLSQVGLTVNSDHYNDPWSNPTGRTTSMGFFGSVAYRFYPMDNTAVLNKFYVSPVFRYRIFRYGLTDYTGNLGDKNGSEGHSMFMFNFGYQKWLSDHFSLDMFAGLGLVYENHKTFYGESVYDSNTGNYLYNWVEDKYDGVRLGMTIGVKIGIGR